MFLVNLSYTLECNYNSGRQCNAVSPATSDDGRASPPLPYSPMPHKYNVATFQHVCLLVIFIGMHGLKKFHLKFFKVRLICSFFPGHTNPSLTCLTSST